MDAKIPTLPEILRDRGYRTAAFTGGLDYHPQFGHMRGFQEAEVIKERRPAVFAGFEPTLEKASQWLDAHGEEQFFLFLHGYDTHCPFAPPDDVRGIFSDPKGKNITVNLALCLRGLKTSVEGVYEAQYFNDGMQHVQLTQDDVDHLEDLYDEEILSVDGLVGAFLADLDSELLERTIVIIFSDHGAMFAKHGRFGRAGAERGTLYDEVARIPWLMKIPRQPGKRVNGLVQLIDLMPTVLAILGFPEPAFIQGKNVMPLVNGTADEINRYVFAGSSFGGPRDSRAWRIYPARTVNESVRTQEWKLIHEVILDGESPGDERYELYHLQDDPEELQDLVGKRPAIVAQLKKVLSDWKRQAEGFEIRDDGNARSR